MEYYAESFVYDGPEGFDIRHTAEHGSVEERDQLARALILLARAGNPKLMAQMIPVLATIMRSEDHAVVDGVVVFPGLRVVAHCYDLTTAGLENALRGCGTWDGILPSYGFLRYHELGLSGELWVSRYRPEGWPFLWARCRGTTGKIQPLQEGADVEGFLIERAFVLRFFEGKGELKFFEHTGGEEGTIRLYYREGVLMPEIGPDDGRVYFVPGPLFGDGS